MARELFVIVKVGDECPKCKAVWGEGAEGRIQSIRIECDSLCVFRRKCQAEIDQNGLEGFRCKDRRWTMVLGARCKHNMTWYRGCSFAHIGAGSNNQPVVTHWQEGYPGSWDGWS